MSAKHTHTATKDQQSRAHAASLKTKRGKKSKVTFAGPMPFLFKRVTLNTGETGQVVEYSAGASEVYTVQCLDKTADPYRVYHKQVRAAEIVKVG